MAAQDAQDTTTAASYPLRQYGAVTDLDSEGVVTVLAMDETPDGGFWIGRRRAGVIIGDALTLAPHEAQSLAEAITRHYEVWGPRRAAERGKRARTVDRNT